MEKEDDWISIVYYKRWAQMLMDMPDELRHKIHDAIDEYIVSRTVPEDKSALYPIFVAIKEQIDYDMRTYYDKIIKMNRRIPHETDK